MNEAKQVTTDGRTLGEASAAVERSAQPAGSVFRDLALKVSNDISEDIDGGESREELREVVRWWAQKACDEAQRRATAEQTVKMFSMAKQLMDIALPPNIGGES